MSSSGWSCLSLDPLRGHVVLERLREKKRCVGSTWRQFPEELARAAKAALLDAQRSSGMATTTATAQALNLNLEERQGLRLCLDALQERIPVKTASDLACRLQALASRTGLKYSATLAHGCYYLSNEMFYVEISSDAKESSRERQEVQEARIHHIDATKTILHQEANNCVEMVECLRNNDFKSFQSHLEALIDIYSLEGASAIEKSQAWMALNLLESDVSSLYMHYMHQPSSSGRVLSDGDIVDIIHSSPLGLYVTRRGGLPSKIIFLLPPSHLIRDKKWLKCDRETILKFNLGISAEVCIESDGEKRNILPIASVVRYDQNNQLTLEEALPSNSLQLPARFTLKLSEPLVICNQNCENIEHLTSENLEKKDSKAFVNHTAPHLNRNSSVTVELPGTTQSYVFSGECYVEASAITSIAFTHLECLMEVVEVIRKQALFNTLITSCLKNSSSKKSGLKNILSQSPRFEISFGDLDLISVNFILPLLRGTNCLCIVRIQLLAMAGISVSIEPRGKLDDLELRLIYPHKKANAVLKRTMSIPVLMRSILGYSKKQRDAILKHISEEEASKKQDFRSEQLNIKKECPSSPNRSEEISENRSNEKMEKTKIKGEDVSKSRNESLAVKVEPKDSNGKTLNETKKQPDLAAHPSVSAGAKRHTGKHTDRQEASNSINSISGSRGRIGVVSNELSMVTNSKSKLESRLKSPNFNDIKPSVSITPVSSVQPTQSHLSMTSMDSNRGSVTASSNNLGIEIIPLNRNPNSGKASSSTSLKRSFSEDFDANAKTSKGAGGLKRKHPSSDEQTTSNFGKLLEKISASGTPMLLGSEGIEVSVATSESSNSPASKSLKLTLKTPSSRGSSPTSSGKKSSSGSKHYSSSSSSSKSHHHSSSRHSSPKKDTKKDRRKGSGSSSSGSHHHSHHYHHHSSSSSHKSSSTSRSRDDPHFSSSSKLSKPFQIPKLSKSKSPSPKHSFSASNQSSSSHSGHKQAVASTNAGSSSEHLQSGGSMTTPSSGPKSSDSGDK